MSIQSAIDELSKKLGTPKERIMSFEYLRECLDYNPETGIFTWKERPRRHFNTDIGWKVANTQKAGKTAGCPNSKGYMRISFAKNAKQVMHLRAHRVAWLFVSGGWPKGDIDHINGITSDNRICNLREATRSENKRNQNLSKSNTSGVKGVSRFGSSGKWAAGLMHNGRHIHLGLFSEKSDAALTVRNARERIHKQFANHGDGQVLSFHSNLKA